MKLMPIRFALLTLCLAGGFARADIVYMSELYDSEYNSASILQFDPDGTKSRFAGEPFSAPNGLNFDSSGDLYVAYFSYNAIWRYDAAGSGSAYAATGLNQPIALAFAPGGDLYVANLGDGPAYIQKIDAAGQSSVFATGLYQPQGIACDAAGNVYVSSWINNNSATAILKYDPSGNVSTFAITSSLGIPRGLTFYEGDLYATFGRSVQRYAPNGSRTVAASTGLVNAIGVAFDSAGNFYVTDQGSASIMKFAPNGAGAVFASNLNAPTYIAVQIVPEPAAVSLWGLGLLAVFCGQRRRLGTGRPGDY